MKIKGIVFDKDGTLIDYAACWLERTEAATKKLLASYGAEQAYPNIMKRMGVTEDGNVDIRGALCHSTYYSISLYYAEEMAKFGIYPDPDAFYGELVTAFNEYKHLSRSVPAAEGIDELFSKLKEMDIRLALVTTDNKEGAKRTLAPLGIFDSFDTVLCSDGIHPSKPDPYYMNLFLSEYHLAPDEVLMVGDTESDMLFGRNAGTYTLAVGKTEQNRAYLSPLADFTAESVLAIPDIISGQRAGGN